MSVETNKNNNRGNSMRTLYLINRDLEQLYDLFSLKNEPLRISLPIAYFGSREI
ncbi:hypothetical protein Noda2021_04110 [Candidatus Dependentiae bacterium Noda2021]|nr:hypothetical protein Noda2021_04110 [Candidatus Dependentiae bacterium Noda2021]